MSRERIRPVQSNEKSTIEIFGLQARILFAAACYALTSNNKTIIGLPQGYEGNRMSMPVSQRIKRFSKASIYNNGLTLVVPDGVHATTTTSSGETITVDDNGKASVIAYTAKNGARQSIGLNSRIRSARFGPKTFHRDGSYEAKFSP